MRIQGETRELQVNLTPEELAEKAGEMALAIEDEDAYRTAFEIWQKNMKASKKKQDAELARLHECASDLARVVRDGVTKRDVTCQWLYALDEGYAFLVRDDTSELVTHRKLRDEERQMEIGETPFREPTPEQLAEWLKTLPVAEEPDLGEGHADEVSPEDKAVDLTGEEQTRAYEEEIWESDVEDEDDLFPDGDIEKVPTPALDALEAMPQEEAAALVRRQREAAGIRVPDEEF